MLRYYIDKLLVENDGVQGHRYWSHNIWNEANHLFGQILILWIFWQANNVVEIVDLGGVDRHDQKDSCTLGDKLDNCAEFINLVEII